MNLPLFSLRHWLAALLAVACAAVAPAATDYTVLDTTIVSETRVGRTVFDYQMRVTVRNNGAAIDALALRVSSGVATTSTVVNAVNFGAIAAGATAESADTFTVRVDRTAPFEPAALTWVELPAPPGPTVTPITGPTNSNTSAISGSAAPGATIEITGGTSVVRTEADDVTGAFSTTVGLQRNRINRIYTVAIDGAGRRSPPTAVEILHDAQPPSLFIDFPADGAELTNESVVVAGRVGDSLSGFLGLDVTVNDQPANVVVGIGQNGTFERGGIPLAVGANTITAVATDENGNFVTKTINVTRVPITGPQMAVISGDGQIAKVHVRLTAPVIVRVTEADGTTPIANKIVTFTVTRSNGRLFASSVASTETGAIVLQVPTDTSGLARAFWQMGSDAGCGNNRVAVTSRDIAGTTYFCASANPATPTQINIGSGNNQRGEAGAPLPQTLRAWVNDSCNGAVGVPVLFTVISGGGQINGSDAAVVDTSITGHAEVVFTLGYEQGNNVVEASYAGNPGAPATFVAYGVVRQGETPTSFVGLVLNNSSQPIGGATCTLQIAGSTIRNATTTADGRFVFSDCPSGTGYVHINGLPATSTGGVAHAAGSYPALSYSVVVVPNAENSLPTPVLLPKLNPANAKTYDGTKDVILTCEGIAGLKMTVKAGSMRRFDGSLPTPENPEIITLNQVHHDDIPMPMPDGAAPPFAWTLQPAGATFEPAITIEYPNMSGLPAGAIAYFLSFNHATERFEIVAGGHVTADGSTIVTDPGVGLTVAGWGCNCPPYSVASDCCKLETNGCGAQGSWFKPPDSIPGIFDFKAACDYHDSCYGTLDVAKSKCDRDFLILMLSNCAPRLGLFQLQCIEFAFAYYGAVHFFGGGAYEEGQDKARRCRSSLSQSSITSPTIEADDDIPLPPFQDDDHDFLPDDWELAAGLDPTDPTDAATDPDQDGLSNLFEYVSLNDPFNPDSDGDGLSDGRQFMDENPPTESLDDTWKVTVGGKTVNVDRYGSFLIPNVAAPDQFGPGGPGTRPDFISDDFVRLVGVKSADGANRYVFSDPFQIRQDSTFIVGPLTFTDSPPPLPESIRFSSSLVPLTQIGELDQLQVLGTLTDGSTVDLTLRTAWTSYRSSNPEIIIVNVNGVVAAVGRGIAYVTAVNEGATAVTQVIVAPGDALTTVSGFIRDENGLPANGVTVRVTGFGTTATTNASGGFEIPNVPTTFGAINVAVQVVNAGGAFVGRAQNLATVAGGFTDAGLITLLPAVAWTGTASANWNVAANWTSGVVPGPDDDVYISAAAGVTITHSTGDTTIASLFTDNPFVLSGGTLTVTETVQANVPFTLSGGTLKGATILPGGGDQDVSVVSGTMDDVMLAGKLSVGASRAVTVINGLVLGGGTVTLQGNASIHFLGTQTLGGTGEVVFGGSAGQTSYLYARAISSSTSAALTIEPEVLIHGPQNGWIGPWFGPETIALQGIVRADTASRSISINGNWSSARLLGTANGGTVNLAGTFSFVGSGTFDSTGGTIHVTGTLDNSGNTLTFSAATGGVTMSSTGRIRGGRIVGSGGTVNAGTGIFEGVTLGSDLIVRADKFIYIVNGLTLDNTRLILEGNSTVYATGTQTIGGTGEIVFGGSANQTNYLYAYGQGSAATAAVLTIGQNVLVHGNAHGQIRANYTQYDRVINQGTITADTPGQTITVLDFLNQGTISASGGAISLGGSWSGPDGVISVANQGLLTLGGSFAGSALDHLDYNGGTVNLTGALNNAGHTLQLDAGGGSWNITSDATISGGTISVAAGTAFSSPSGILSGVTFTGDLRVPAGGSLYASNGLTLTVGSRILLQGNATAYFVGTQTLGGSGEVVFGGTGSQTSNLYAIGGNTLVTAAALTIGPNITLHGPLNGEIAGYYATDSVIHQGTIAAETAGRTMTLWRILNQGTITAPAGTVVFNGNWSGPDGLLSVAGTGVLNLGGAFPTSALDHLTYAGGIVNVTGILDNTGHTLALDAASGTWNLNNANAVIRSGTIAVSNGTAFNAVDGTLDGVTFSGDLTVPVSRVLDIRNGLTLATARLLLQGNATVYFRDTQSFAGTGEVVFGGTGTQTDYLYAVGGNSVATAAALTIGPNITLHGPLNGEIGGYYASDSVIHQGTITAETAGRTMTLWRIVNQGTISAPAGTVVFNGNWSGPDGLLSVAGTGVLNLGGAFPASALDHLVYTGGTVSVTGLLNNAGHNLVLDANSGVWNLAHSAATITGGSITVANGTVFNAVDGALDGVTVTGDLAVPASRVLDIHNGLTLANGRLLLQGNATVYFRGTQSFTGTGEVVFGGTGTQTDYLYALGGNTVATAAVLTISPGISLHGPFNGEIGGYYASDSLIHLGTITADTAGRTMTLVRLVNAGSIAASAGTVVLTGGWSGPDGALSVAGTGVLSLGGTFSVSALDHLVYTGGIVNVTGILDNTGRTLLLDATSGTWNLNHANAVIRGGTIAVSNGTVFNTVDGSLEGITFSGDLTVPASRVLDVRNGLTLATARVLLQGNATVYFRGTQTFAGTGEVVFGGTGTQTDYLYAVGGNSAATAATLTISPGISLHGPLNGEIGGYYATDSLVHQGTITADTAGRTLTLVRLVNQGNISAPAGTVTMTGAWTGPAGVFSVAGTGVLNLGGTFPASALDHLSYAGGTVNVTGTLDNAGHTLVLDAASGNWNLNNNAVIRGGTIAVSNGTLFNAVNGEIDGVTFTGDLSIAASQSLDIRNGLTLANGRLRLQGNAAAYFRGTQTLGGTGEVLFEGAANQTSYLYGIGGNSAASAATLTIGPNLLMHGPQNGHVGGYYTTDSVSHQGTITADTAVRTITLVRLANQGTVAATAGGISLSGVQPNVGLISIGAGRTVTATGGFTNAAGGTLQFEIAGPAATQFGKLSVSGAATLDGTLAIATTVPYQPATTATFAIITSTTRAGTFATVIGTVIGNGNQYSPTYATNNVTLNVVAVGGSPQVTPDAIPGGQRLINFSALDTLPAGGGVVISGFVLRGGGTSRILVRAAGPGLAAFDVPQTAANPFVRLLDATGHEIARNDQWDGALADTFTATGAFALTAESADAALVADLGAGLYFVQAGESDGAGGNLIVEVYEVPQVAGATPQLVNLSVRTRLEPGDLLVPGFVLNGAAPMRVLIRAVGPGLRAHGVNDAAANPRLTVFGADGRVISANDDWSSDGREALLSATFRAVGAFALDAGSQDAAVIVDVDPGATTIQVEGAGTGGTVIVEVYVVSEQ